MTQDDSVYEETMSAKYGVQWGREVPRIWFTRRDMLIVRIIWFAWGLLAGLVLGTSVCTLIALYKFGDLLGR